MGLPLALTMILSMQRTDIATYGGIDTDGMTRTYMESATCTETEHDIAVSE